MTSSAAGKLEPDTDSRIDTPAGHADPDRRTPRRRRRARHARIRHSMERIRESLSHKGACVMARLRIQLAELQQRIPGECDLEIFEGAPSHPLRGTFHLAYRVARLRGQHQALTQELRALVERAERIDDEAEIEGYQRRVAPFLRALDAHLKERELLIAELRAAGDPRTQATTSDSR